jgi:D-cysteine desulfhydrase
MKTPAFERLATKLATPETMSLGHRWVSLINEPTPVLSVPGIKKYFGQEIFVKREDLTAPGYGGNKVRNLEFLLGDALSQDASRVVTAAPLGSNFTAALSAQAKRIGMNVDIFHFVPQINLQITKHADFTREQGANMKIFRGASYPSAMKAFLLMQSQRFEKSYLIAPGGSSAVGVIGHISAALELAEQVERNEIPEPDYLIVGVGTCGTIAGLIAGIKLAGLRTKIIGVRCVDRIVCNKFQIRSLANQSLKKLGLSLRIKLSDIDLRDNAGSINYGVAHGEAATLMQTVHEASEITLDTTYTSKVMLFVRNFIATHSVSSKNILYWHTFSPAAMLRAAIAA